MIRVADYIAQTLADYGVKHLFMVTGGGAMFLNDAIGKEHRIKYICNHHEQACAMAAEGYARVTGKVGVINVTTGPGGINALNGVFGAWTDSIPMLILSGQVKRETLLTSYDLPNLRQLGDQEADIIPMVKGITKYAQTVMDPLSIRYCLEKALYLAEHGRPGPCWLDVPIDIQSAQVDENVLQGYSPETHSMDMDLVRQQVARVLEKIRKVERPVILAGTGIRLAGAMDIFDTVIHKLGIPVTTAWTHDIIASDDPVFCGRPGTIGTRPGNFVVQNSDLLLTLGSRLNIRQTSYNYKSFAHHAYKIQVDIDPAELKKPTLQPDMPIVCDARIFLEELNRQLDDSNYDKNQHAVWLEWCKQRLEMYPAVTPRMREYHNGINPYHFMDTLSQSLNGDDIIVTGNATACIVSFQTAQIKKGQRLFSNSGCASMGYDLPAAIGAAIAANGKRVICLAGDGSIQMNIQELQTVVHHHLNVKIFVLNNNGYLSIRSTQKNFFKEFVGESPISGVSFPDFIKIGSAYGLSTYKLNSAEFLEKLRDVLATPGPVLCEVVLNPDQPFEPRSSSKQLPDGRIISPPLEDMFPFLDRDEMNKNILYKQSVPME